MRLFNSRRYGAWRRATNTAVWRRLGGFLRVRGFLWAVWVVLGMGVGGAWAVTPVVLVDRELRRQRVAIQGLGDGVVTYYDAQRELQVDPVGRYVQIIVVDERSGRDEGAGEAAGANPGDGGASGGMLELVDGQRLAGQWAGAGRDGQGLRWRHAALGEVVVELERLRAVWVTGAAEDGGRESERGVAVGRGADTAWLANGDALEGFVVAVEEDGLVFQVEGGREPVRLPVERVRGVVLGTDAEPAVGGVTRVELRDGSRVVAGSVRIESDRVVLEAGPLELGASSLEMGEVDGLILGGAEQVGVVGFTGLERRVSRRGRVFGLEAGVRVRGRDIHVHAPVTVELDLPVGARRIGCTVRLNRAAGDVDEGWGWADCRVVLRVDGREVGRAHLERGREAVQINAAVDGEGVLSIEVDQAANGPVMDRVVIEGGVVLVGESAGG